MRTTPKRLYTTSAQLRYAASPQPTPLISIENATFYHHHPEAHPDPVANPPLFPGLSFDLSSRWKASGHWAVLSPSTTASAEFLNILRGQRFCLPPQARSYPYLNTPNVAKQNPASRNPANAIQYIGFENFCKGQYLGARYESFRDTSDRSVCDYLRDVDTSQTLLSQVMHILDLSDLADVPIRHLNTEQSRRARIAKAVLRKPALILLESPFAGLDPDAIQALSELLYQLDKPGQPQLMLSLKPQDVIPDWIDHFVLMGYKPEVAAVGTRHDIFKYLGALFGKSEGYLYDARSAYEKMSGLKWAEIPVSHSLDILNQAEEVDKLHTFRDIARKLESKGDFDVFANKAVLVGRAAFLNRKGSVSPKSDRELILTRDGWPRHAHEVDIPIGEPLVQMEGVRVAYDDKVVLGDWKQPKKDKSGLWWDVRRGERWAILGPNGCGKTTLTSLITSDHPQAYSVPMRLFGRPRVPGAGEPATSIFDVKARIGHTSSEVHESFPRHLTLRQVIESAWADTPLSKPRLDYASDQKVDGVLRWFRADLHPTLGETPDQRAEHFRPPRDSRDYEDARRKTSRFVRITGEQLRQEDVSSTDLLDWADALRFSDLSFSAQRLALFLRAMIHEPDLLVLDEAFLGMDESTRDKAMLFLSHGQTMAFRYVNDHRLISTPGPRPVPSDLSRLGHARVPGLQPHQALICVAHAREDVPGCVMQWIRLPGREKEAEEDDYAEDKPKPYFGVLKGPMNGQYRLWVEVWGVRGLQSGSLDMDVTKKQNGSYSRLASRVHLIGTEKIKENEEKEVEEDEEGAEKDEGEEEMEEEEEEKLDRAELRAYRAARRKPIRPAFRPQGSPLDMYNWSTARALFGLDASPLARRIQAKRSDAEADPGAAPKKKRGRPSKADIEAAEAAEAQELAERSKGTVDEAEKKKLEKEQEARRLAREDRLERQRMNNKRFRERAGLVSGIKTKGKANSEFEDDEEDED